MLTYVIRRLLLAIPTLLFISLAIFLLLDLAPGDPTSQIPLTVPPEVREKIRLALGLGEPIHVRYLLWLKQFFNAHRKKFKVFFERIENLFDIYLHNASARAIIISINAQPSRNRK